MKRGWLLLICVILCCVTALSACGTPRVEATQPSESVELTQEPTTPPTTEATTPPTTEPPETTAPATEPETTEPTTEPETTEAATEELTEVTTEADLRDYVVNTNTGKFHYPSCASAKKIKDSNRAERHCTREDLIAQGYVPCAKCNP